MERWIEASSFAMERHAGQKYGDGDYYLEHLHVVAQKVEKLFGFNDDLIAVAYLHDILEDTETTWDQVAAKFGTFIADIVWILTKLKEDSYSEHIRKVSNNTFAAKVKYADAMTNFEKCVETKQWARSKKYADVLALLEKTVM